ncbi:MAG TPA: hypothetical protein VK137_18555 [Planctomycetaceae bacterium]|nr:hypothetical protein [Planctomycetaceae bacterium]
MTKISAWERGSFALMPAHSKRTQLGDILALLAQSKPGGPTEIATNLRRIAAMVRHRSLMNLLRRAG